MRIFRRLMAASLLMLAPAVAWAQGAVLQGGPWAPGRAPMYTGSGHSQPIMQDSGPAGGGPVGLGLSEQLLVARGTGTPPYAAQGSGPLGTNWCNYDAPITNPTGYHFLCLSPNAGGGAMIAYGAAGAAAPLPMQININGVNYPFPGAANGDVRGPSSSLNLDLPVFSSTSGKLLLDSGKKIVDLGQQVSNNATLASHPIADFPLGVNRLGFYVSGDNAPLAFMGQTGTCAAHSLVNDGGNCVDVAADGNSWVAIYATNERYAGQFGTKCDAASDDVLSINAAISSTSVINGALWLPKGTCIVGVASGSQGVRLLSNVHLHGQGQNVTTIKTADTAGIHGIYINGTTTSTSNIGLYDLTIDANYPTNPSAGTSCIDEAAGPTTSVDNFTIRNVTVQNCSTYGFGAQSGSNTNFSWINASCINTGAACWEFKNSGNGNDKIIVSNSTAKQCVIRTNTNACADLRGPVIFSNIEIDGIGTAGGNSFANFRNDANDGTGGATTNGARKGRLSNFYFKGGDPSVTYNITGISIGGDNVQITNGYIDGVYRGISGLSANAQVSNVTVHNFGQLCLSTNPATGTFTGGAGLHGSNIKCLNDSVPAGSTGIFIGNSGQTDNVKLNNVDIVNAADGINVSSSSTNTFITNWNVSGETGSKLINTGIGTVYMGVGGSSIPGVTGSTMAAAGAIGEQISCALSSGSAVSLTTATAIDICSLVLTAGDWEVTGVGGFTYSSTTGITDTAAWVSGTSATLPSSANVAVGVSAIFRQQASSASVSGGYNTYPTGRLDLHLAASATYYLSQRSVFTGGTVVGYGYAVARRVH